MHTEELTQPRSMSPSARKPHFQLELWECVGFRNLDEFDPFEERVNAWTLNLITLSHELGIGEDILEKSLAEVYEAGSMARVIDPLTHWQEKLTRGTTLPWRARQKLELCEMLQLDCLLQNQLITPAKRHCYEFFMSFTLRFWGSDWARPLLRLLDELYLVPDEERLDLPFFAKARELSQDEAYLELQLLSHRRARVGVRDKEELRSKLEAIVAEAENRFEALFLLA